MLVNPVKHYSRSLRILAISSTEWGAGTEWQDALDRTGAWNAAHCP